MKKTIITLVTLALCLLSAYPLMKLNQLDDYSTLVFITYYRAFLWLIWAIILVFSGIVVFVDEGIRKKYWRLYLVNFVIIFVVIFTLSLKVQIENQESVKRGKIIQP